MYVLLPFWTPSSPFYYPLFFLLWIRCYSKHIVSTVMSACLVWAPPPGVAFYTAEERRKTWLHRAMSGRSTCGGMTATARTSAGHRPIILLLYTPLDLRPIIVRWPHGGPAEIGQFLALFSQEKSDGGPQVTARCSDGVPTVAGGWRNYPRNRPIIRQILIAS